MSALSDEIGRLQQYLACDPDNRDLQARLCDRLIEAQRWAEAQTLIEGVLAGAPGDPYFRYRQAMVLAGQADYAPAIAMLAALMAEGFDDPALRFELGRMQFLQADFGAALTMLMPLVDNPAAAAMRESALVMAVRCLHQQSRFEEAIALAERGMTDTPQQPRSPERLSALVSALATICLDAGRLEDARYWVKAGQSLGPQSAELEAASGALMLIDARPDLALEQFEASLALMPGLGRAHLGRGMSLALTGKLEDAAQSFEAATRAMPAHLGSYHALGWMQLLSGQIEGAEKTFRTALGIDRNFGESWGALAVVCLMRGDARQAEEMMSTAHRLDSQSLGVAAATMLLQMPGLDEAAFRAQALALIRKRFSGSGVNVEGMLRGLW